MLHTGAYALHEYQRVSMTPNTSQRQTLNGEQWMEPGPVRHFQASCTFIFSHGYLSGNEKISMAPNTSQRQTLNGEQWMEPGPVRHFQASCMFIFSHGCLSGNEKISMAPNTSQRQTLRGTVDGTRACHALSGILSVHFPTWIPVWEWENKYGTKHITKADSQQDILVLHSIAHVLGAPGHYTIHISGCGCFINSLHAHNDLTLLPLV